MHLSCVPALNALREDIWTNTRKAFYKSFRKRLKKTDAFILDLPKITIIRGPKKV